MEKSAVKGYLFSSLWQSLSLLFHPSLVTWLGRRSQVKKLGLETKSEYCINTQTCACKVLFIKCCTWAANAVPCVTFFCSQVLVLYALPLQSLPEQKTTFLLKYFRFQVTNNFLQFSCHCFFHGFILKKKKKSSWLKQQQSKQRQHLIIILFDYIMVSF